MPSPPSPRPSPSFPNGGNRDSNPERSDLKGDRFPLVGIGASAGGLEAFSQLLQGLPDDTGMAFVLVQHLEPSNASFLSEILARATSLPVQEIQDDMAIAPNCVYVIPPNTCLSLVNYHLKLEPRRRTKGKNRPIDVFFQSLAMEWGAQAIAILLSGADEDGTLGLATVKKAGGITFAQDPALAEFAIMPQSAIATGCVDFVLSPTDIAKELVNISRHPLLSPPTVGASDRSPTNNTETLLHIFALLRAATGVDFTHYKKETLRRRMVRRMLLHHLETLEDYVQYLQDNPSELGELYQDILIGVTRFFRDSTSFDFLKKSIFPLIIQNKSADTPIRFWVPGCSTGEEAYSLAISLLEFLSDRPFNPPIQIFATDINEMAIEQARLGIYSQNLLAEVSADRLSRFFVPVEMGYQISKPVRELCVFSRQNLVSDPPFSRLDLISCRNVLIYLEPVLQKRIIPIFHYALKPMGLLMLGTSESIGEFSDLFELTDKKNRIYTRKLAPIRLDFNFVPSTMSPEQSQSDPIQSISSSNDEALEQAANQIVLDQYTPSGVIINSDLEIVQFRGQTSPYLEPVPAKASLNLLKMVRSDLTLELRAAIHRAKQQGVVARQEGLELQLGTQRRTVNLEVIPLPLTVGGERYFLVLFVSGSPLPQPIFSSLTPPLKKSKKVRQLEAETEVTRLQQELATTRDYLQSIIESQEATNQDLKVANEEILSSNEELQSTNEELETAKEEIQATNEELSTINEELRNRNLQMNQVNNDLQNLLSSVHIPMLMLSGDLRIRRFTPLAGQLFNLIPSDVGRPFTDIQPAIALPHLAETIISVVDSLNTHEQEIQDQSGQWYSLRIRPYKTAENRIDGAVIVLVDIDALKRSSMLLEAARNYADAIVETVRDSLVVLNADFNVITANRAFYETFQRTPAQTEQQSLFSLGEGEWNIPRLRLQLEAILPDNSCLQDFELQDFEVEQQVGEKGQRILLLNARPIAHEGMEMMILLAIADITERKQAEEQIRHSLQEKEILLREIRHRVKNNLQVISSLLSLQRSRVKDEQASKILQDSQCRVQTIALMHEILHQSDNLAELNFADYIQALVAYLFKSYNLHPEAIASRVMIAPNLVIHPDRAMLCGLIIAELVTNALKYGFPEDRGGEVWVQIEELADKSLTLAVGNEGDYLPTDFNLEALPSIGLNLVINMARQLNGTLYLERGNQTIFTVRLPP